MVMLRLAGVLLFALLFSPQTVIAAPEYIGSEICADCHASVHADWRETGHHLQLRDADVAQKTGFELPKGYTWDDISYVIGGFKTKANFVDKAGYIVTSAKNSSKSKTMYDLKDRTWSDYFPGEKKAYDCVSCHTTGYNPEGSQGGRPGIVGTWRENGIGCEMCHGPGSEHVDTPTRKYIIKTRSEVLCAQCHQRGGIDNRPLSEIGLVRHHEQINELKSGVHKGLSCLNCHNPHRRASRTKDNCTICHSRVATRYEQGVHGQEGITCIECHMAEIPKPAIARASYIGNVRTHLFKINVDTQASMFITIEEKGRISTFTEDFLALEFVCLGCHEAQTKKWALEHAKAFHQ